MLAWFEPVSAHLYWPVSAHNININRFREMLTLFEPISALLYWPLSAHQANITRFREMLTRLEPVSALLPISANRKTPIRCREGSPARPISATLPTFRSITLTLSTRRVYLRWNASLG